MVVLDGSSVELLDGLWVGIFVGAAVSGILEGCDVGEEVGLLDGAFVGSDVKGALVGLPVILMASYL